jgi:hypothetical protein
MSANPPEKEKNTPHQTVAELQTILANYKADDSSWPGGLLHLRRSIKLRADYEEKLRRFNVS